MTRTREHPDPGTWDCSQARIALGVYVLGAIDPAERELLDAHLETCAECREELADLADLPGLLALVGPEEAMALAEGSWPGDATSGDEQSSVAELTGPLPAGLVPTTPVPVMPSPRPPKEAPEKEIQLHQTQAPAGKSPAETAETAEGAEGRRAEGRRGDAPADEPPPELLGAVLDLTAARRRRSRLLSGGLVAAAAVIIAAASFGGTRLAAGPSGSAPSAAGQQNYGQADGAWETASQVAGGLGATIQYRQMGWGTQVAAKVVGVPVGTQCQLYVVRKDGSRVYGGSWITDASENAISYPASAATSAENIKQFVITLAGTGQTITVSPS